MQSQTSAEKTCAPACAFPGTTFQEKAPFIIEALQNDLQLTLEQAAGILGNVGHESAGMTILQEIKPTAGRGGYGWMQWTGPRRRDYEAFGLAQGLDLAVDGTNYRFLLHELRGTEGAALRALRATSTVEQATTVFEQVYERAGVAALASRLRWAQIAMATTSR